MLTKVAMHALDYDAKLIPSPVMERMGNDEATDVILGANLDPCSSQVASGAWCETLVEGHESGCSLLGHVAMLAAELGRPVERVADEEMAQQARLRLEQAGVCAQRNAILKFSDVVTRVYAASPRNQEKCCDDIPADQPVREMSMVSTKTHSRLLARILHGLEALEASHLWDKADDEVRTVMLSSGGQGNGSLWIAPTRSARDLLPDAHFSISTALRLGCESNAKGRMCALLRDREDPESQCGQKLDTRLHHTLTCKAGLARMRQHRAVAATLTNVLKQSGAQGSVQRRTCMSRK